VTVVTRALAFARRRSVNQMPPFEESQKSSSWRCSVRVPGAAPAALIPC
jgi:hypothetical protein